MGDMTPGGVRERVAEEMEEAEERVRGGKGGELVIGRKRESDREGREEEKEK